MMRALLMTLALMPLRTPAQFSGKPAMAPFVADDGTITATIAPTRTSCGVKQGCP